MDEMEKYELEKFEQWSKLKLRIDERDPRPYFKIREVWWASIGQNIGDEQNGKNQLFERPVLIVQKFYNNLFLALPLSTKAKRGNYYFRKTVNQKDGVVILSQSRVLDSKRLLRKIEMLDENSFSEIVNQYKKLIY
jgi:mRNA interferase MazF